MLVAHDSREQDSHKNVHRLLRFDVQAFMGNSRPVRTCCYCKEDGHIKTQCPDLRKPPLRLLPPMTSQFGDVLDFACRTCRSKHTF